jgi:hypothetical protein
MTRLSLFITIYRATGKCTTMMYEEVVALSKNGTGPKRTWTPISIRFEADIKTTIERLAKSDRRSVASWVEKYVIDHMQSEGLLPKDGEEEDKAE